MAKKFSNAYSIEVMHDSHLLLYIFNGNIEKKETPSVFSYNSSCIFATFMQRMGDNTLTNKVIRFVYDQLFIILLWLIDVLVVILSLKKWSDNQTGRIEYF